MWVECSTMWVKNWMVLRQVEAEAARFADVNNTFIFHRCRLLIMNGIETI